MGSEGARIEVTITPQAAAGVPLTWTSSDEDVATVDDGVVTAVGRGTATITASVSPTLSATCEVRVVDVYVAGRQKNTEGIYVAKVWINGAQYALTEGTYNASAESVFVLGDDVYAAGYQRNTENIKVGKVWKLSRNNSVVGLYSTNGLTDATFNSIFVDGDNVYVAGSQDKTLKGYSVATLWTNGVARQLDGGTIHARANAVFVADNHVYVTTYNTNASNYNVVKLWTDGVATNLTNGTEFAQGYSVFASGGSAYVAGYQRGETVADATIWKKTGQDVTPIKYAVAYRASYAYAVFVSGDDIYAAGVRQNNDLQNVATIWKNGQAQDFTDGSYSINDLSIYVSGSDVYVAGEASNFDANRSNETASKCWRNGVEIPLRDALTMDSSAHSVFVVE